MFDGVIFGWFGVCMGGWACGWESDEKNALSPFQINASEVIVVAPTASASVQTTLPPGDGQHASKLRVYIGDEYGAANSTDLAVTVYPYLNRSGPSDANQFLTALNESAAMLSSTVQLGNPRQVRCAPIRCNVCASEESRVYSTMIDSTMQMVLLSLLVLLLTTDAVITAFCFPPFSFRSPIKCPF